MRADKRLGQHFLRDVEVLTDIAAIAAVHETGGVLEIGPGEGALTGFLMRGNKPVVVLDKDPRAIEAVYERFGEAVQGVLGDALHADLDALLPSGPPAPIVVGNLPYNVGTAILQRLLTLTGRVSRLVVMLQHEVAARVVASSSSKAYGLLTVLTWLSGDAWIVREVPPEAFAPRPKVNSSVVLIELRSEPRIPEEERAAFTQFAGGLFRSRRKMLRKTFENLEGLKTLGVEPTARPEDLTPEQILALYRLESPLDDVPRDD